MPEEVWRKLNKQERRVAKLRKLGWTHRQIADRFGISQESSRLILVLARRRLEHEAKHAELREFPF